MSARTRVHRCVCMCLSLSFSVYAWSLKLLTCSVLKICEVNGKCSMLEDTKKASYLIAF